MSPSKGLGEGYLIAQVIFLVLDHAPEMLFKTSPPDAEQKNWLLRTRLVLFYFGLGFFSQKGILITSKSGLIAH